MTSRSPSEIPVPPDGKDAPCEAGELIYEGEIRSTARAQTRLMVDLLDCLTDHGYSVHPFYDRLIVDELLSNAVQHGNGSDPERKVRVRLFDLDGAWRLEVEDEGEGFDHESALEFDFESADRSRLLQTHGRGLPILKAFGVELEYLDGGRCVRATRGPELRVRRPENSG